MVVKKNKPDKRGGTTTEAEDAVEIIIPLAVNKAVANIPKIAETAPRFPCNKE